MVAVVPWASLQVGRRGQAGVQARLTIVMYSYSHSQKWTPSTQTKQAQGHCSIGTTGLPWRARVRACVRQTRASGAGLTRLVYVWYRFHLMYVRGVGCACWCYFDMGAAGVALASGHSLTKNCCSGHARARPPERRSAALGPPHRIVLIGGRASH